MEMRWPGTAKAAVSLTFDDARDTQLDYGAPILEAHGLPATFYVSLGPLEARAAEWSAMARAGHEIGNHTATHPCSANNDPARDNVLEDYTLDDLDRELDQASVAIKRVVGVSPTTFAYPCGSRFVGRGEHTTSYVPLIARRFLAGRGYPDEAMAAPSVLDLAQVPGIPMDRTSTERLLALVDIAIERGAWLVLVAHDVEISTTPVGPTPDLTIAGAVFNDVCESLASNPGVWAATVRDVAGLVASHRRTTAA